jgi:lipopolysaccharide export LptBFGC system permease protein LptF
VKSVSPALTLSYLPRNISPEQDSASNMVIQTLISLVVLVTVFWLSLLFFSFGLFAPRNATAILALFLCALAVAGAIEMTQDLNEPFQGAIRISSKPMKDALDEISLK